MSFAFVLSSNDFLDIYFEPIFPEFPRKMTTVDYNLLRNRIRGQIP